MHQRKNYWRGILLVGLALVGVSLVLPSDSAQALQLYEGDKWKVQLDSTVSFGLMWRVADRDKDIIGIGNGGRKYSVNYDDGNLNYDKGLVSSLAKITSDLDISTENYGVFLRGKAFYDYMNMEEDRERTPLTDKAEDKVGQDLDLLDAYVWGATDLGDVPVQVRVGEQVVSWGESTFIQGGINSINPIDVAAIRGPGAELKEALLPEGMVWGSVGLTDKLSAEGVYIYDWGETELEPRGSYFSFVDFASDGSDKLLLGFGAVGDNGNASAADTLLAVPRGKTIEGDDDSQYGLALRYYSPELNDTEFGLFYLRYNNRLPNLNVRTGTAAGQAAAGAIIADPSIPAALKPVLALDAYAKTANYHTKYVDDIELFGVSFSTEIAGVALQGEYSFKKDAPLQIDDLELLLSFLGAINPAASSLSQIGPSGIDTDIQGYILRDMSQVQMTATQILQPFWGIDGGVFLAEVGLTHVHNMPDKSTLRLEGPGTVTPGNATAAAGFGVPQTPAGKFADATSWGYRLLAKLDFNNAIGPVSLSPRVAFSHDVNGNSPFGGPFQEDRKAVSTGLSATYLSWSADLSYTNFFGAGDNNWVNDRDNVAFNIKYSF